MKLYISSLVLIILAACSQAIPSDSAIETAIAKTQAAQTAPELADKLSPINPSKTPYPSAPPSTPKPAYTPRPTNTTRPTLTPTPLPAPITFTGRGDDVIDLDDKWSGLGIAHVKSTGDSNFIVIGYDSHGNKTDIIVNEIAPIEGYYPLGWNTRDEITRLEIDAEGPWEVTISPIGSIYIPITANVPTTIQGENSTIIGIVGKSDLLFVKALGKSNFIVLGYGEDGLSDVVVNEIAPIEGKFILSPEIFLLVVEAEGPWEMEFTVK